MDLKAITRFSTVEKRGLTLWVTLRFTLTACTLRKTAEDYAEEVAKPETLGDRRLKYLLDGEAGRASCYKRKRK